jgi:hypothetical protein
MICYITALYPFGIGGMKFFGCVLLGELLF